ncbi:hypothetical protein BKA59DRAFT_494057 [Fusarium tricinctum]|uniref:Nadh oxidase n=1 Tax=Fusarium tricinctum TaxID=61284 RepID=A0A8K0WA66_9HYPO|nr:hypothetical protein BKA59DRAFT_494057 [Fusarium tricinctum]
MKSLIWLAFWNLGLFALSICVLAGCRSSMEKNYSLLNWPRSTIGLIWGQECEDATASIIPDIYKFGTSGLCRVTDGKTKCKRQFPPTLNLAQAVMDDLDKAEKDGASIDSTTLEKCREAIDKPVNHGTAKKLGIVMISFIIASVFINIISLVVAAASGSAFSIASTAVLATDALFIFTSIILCIAMMNFEGGGYLKEVHGQEFSDREMIGIAIWMLVAMLIGRVLSNFWLIIGAICILLPIALVFVLFLVRTRGFFAVVRAATAE